MKILRMRKKIFQQPVFCKQVTYVTLICNHKSAIRSYFREKYFANFSNCSRAFLANGCQNVKLCNMLEIWNKLKNGSFFS